MPQYSVFSSAKATKTATGDGPAANGIKILDNAMKFGQMTNATPSAYASNNVIKVLEDCTRQ